MTPEQNAELDSIAETIVDLLLRLKATADPADQSLGMAAENLDKARWFIRDSQRQHGTPQTKEQA